MPFIRQWGFVPDVTFTFSEYASDLLIGYPFPFTAVIPPIPPVVVIPPGPDYETYYRRYLNDPTGVLVSGPAVSVPEGTESDITRYYRRYLNDPSSS